MRFESTTRNSLAPNEPALLLSILDGNLVGGIVKRRPDGRFDEAAIYAEGSIILALRKIPDILKDEGTIKVIIDDGAYWPDTFPKLHVSH